MNDASAILRTGRKFDQVIAGARQVFLSDGFEGASVDDIARAAGVSKATLYSYFPDKRLLFLEVARLECERMAENTVSLIDDEAPPGQNLRVAAHHIVRFLLSDFTQQCFRICVAESERFPELGQTFYHHGPAEGKRRICEFLQRGIEKGFLDIDDVDIAAEQFGELCKVRLWTRLVFGVQKTFNDEEIEAVVENAVKTFLARYGTDKSRL